MRVPQFARASRTSLGCETSGETLSGGLDLAPASPVDDVAAKAQALQLIQDDVLRQARQDGWKHPSSGSPYVRRALRKRSQGRTYWLEVSPTHRSIELNMNMGHYPD